MTQPFRLPLVIGTDICRVSRIMDHEKPNLDRAHSLMSRFLAPKERIFIEKRYPWFTKDVRPADIPPPEMLQNLARSIAGRWAAKEAARKAWGPEIVSSRDLRIYTSPQIPATTIKVVSFANRDVPGKISDQEGKLSISHDGDYAVATVFAEPLCDDIASSLKAQIASAQAKVNGRASLTLKSYAPNHKHLQKIHSEASHTSDQRYDPPKNQFEASHSSDHKYDPRRNHSAASRSSDHKYDPRRNRSEASHSSDHNYDPRRNRNDSVEMPKPRRLPPF